MYAEKPYKGYKLYKVFHKKEKRYFAVLVKSSTDRTTVAWAKYLAEVEIGHKLGRKWHVHHKDGTTTNDRLGNLKVCSPVKHKQLHSDGCRWLLKGKCAFCKRIFCRVHNRHSMSKFRATKYFYCKRSCSYSALKAGAKLTLSRCIIFYGEVSKELK